MRYFIELSYDGTSFSGWQIQNNAVSVQQTIEEGLSKILRQQIEIVGCGRTDAGVHAYQYFAHFDYDEELPGNFLYRINSILGKSIAIKSIENVEPEKHARFSATKRTYQYFMHLKKNPFLDNYSYYLTVKPDVRSMRAAMACLIGTHDFTTFEKKGSDNQNSNCTVFKAELILHNGQIIFRITANRFLRNMVRAIISSLLMVGYGLMPVRDFKKSFAKQGKINLKVVVPAKGLFLWEIKY